MPCFVRISADFVLRMVELAPVSRMREHSFSSLRLRAEAGSLRSSNIKAEGAGVPEGAEVEGSALYAEVMAATSSGLTVWPW